MMQENTFENPKHNQKLLDNIAPFAIEGRSGLLPALHVAQEMYGWISESVAAIIARALKVPLADVFGVIDFYTMLYSRPVGRTVVRVCADPSCSIAGAKKVMDNACDYLGVKPDETTEDGEWTIESTTCLGLCDQAPAALVGDIAIASLDADRTSEWLALDGKRPASIIDGDIRILTRDCGGSTATDLKTYQARDGYLALSKACAELKPVDVIEEVKASGLVGRGGAAFPTGFKWESALVAEGQPKYVVCNADESEPGTFKDRVLMEDNPHQVLEGMLLAGYAIGAEKGYFYIRGEYSRSIEVIKEAIDEARCAGFIGHNIGDIGFNFDIEVRVGAGAYICGEETALFESIEGKRGFPRIKPPFPTTHGLFGKPTVVNNVETLCNIPMIIRDGSEVFRSYGTDKSPGPKLFCLSGDVVRPGLYEVAFGVTLRHIIEDLAGGVKGGSLQAILVGGAAGAFATIDDLDIPLTFEDLRDANLPLGSGVLMVFNELRHIPKILSELAYFFAHESCGKCYPCQLGTQRQYEILQRVVRGQVKSGDKERLLDVGWTMTDASLCGLGQTASTAVISAMDKWPDLIED